jgi:Uma2 family endonuclease
LSRIGPGRRPRRRSALGILAFRFVAPLYASAGISDYWIVDLNGERIEVYREPSEAGYRSMRFHVRGETLSPQFAPDLTIEVDAVLGPPEAAD